MRGKEECHYVDGKEELKRWWDRREVGYEEGRGVGKREKSTVVGRREERGVQQWVEYNV